jgi:hypothetical protein
MWRLIFGDESCNDLEDDDSIVGPDTDQECSTSFLQRLRCFLRSTLDSIVKLITGSSADTMPIAWPANDLKYIAKRSCSKKWPDVDSEDGGRTPVIPTELACRLLPEDADLIAQVPSARQLLQSDLFRGLQVAPDVAMAMPDSVPVYKVARN